MFINPTCAQNLICPQNKYIIVTFAVFLIIRKRRKNIVMNAKFNLINYKLFMYDNFIVKFQSVLSMTFFECLKASIDFCMKKKIRRKTVIMR